MALLGNCDSHARVPYGTLGSERVKWSKEKSRGNKKAVADETLLRHQGCLTVGK